MFPFNKGLPPSFLKVESVFIKSDDFVRVLLRP